MFKNLVLVTGLSLLFFSVLFSSCDKSSDLGLNIIPEKYLFDPDTQDSFTVAAYTYRIDSLLTSGVEKGLLGISNDKIFGESNLSFIAQMRPLDAPSKSSNPDCDSVFLYLKFDTIYTSGASISMEHQVQVDKINTYFNDTLYYYSNIKPESLGSELVGTASFIPETIFKKANVFGKDTIYKLLKIKLDPAFGDYLMQWDGKSFVNYFNGFYVSSKTSNGIVSVFNLMDSYSKVSLYYHKSADTTLYTATYNFSGLCSRINLFNHKYNANVFLPNLDNPENKQDSVVYIQGAGGLKSKIKFPYLDKLKNQGSWIVTRAELTFQTELNNLTNPTYEQDYPAPSEIILQSLDSLNTNSTVSLLDEYALLTSGIVTNYYGAKYKNGQYIFDITYLIQKIVNGKEPNNGLMLTLRNGSVNPSRAVLTSGNHTRKIKLKLSLTKS